MRLKARLGCVLTIPTGHEIETVFSAIDSVPYFDLWYFVLLLKIYVTTPFSSHPAKETCNRVVVVMFGIRKTKRYTAVLVRV